MLYIETPRYEFAIVVKLKQGNCTGRCSWNKIQKIQVTINPIVLLLGKWVTKHVVFEDSAFFWVGYIAQSAAVINSSITFTPT